jgi:hypothetical protein
MLSFSFSVQHTRDEDISQNNQIENNVSEEKQKRVLFRGNRYNELNHCAAWADMGEAEETGGARPDPSPLCSPICCC